MNTHFNFLPFPDKTRSIACAAPYNEWKTSLGEVRERWSRHPMLPVVDALSWSMGWPIKPSDTRLLSIQENEQVDISTAAATYTAAVWLTQAPSGTGGGVYNQALIFRNDEAELDSTLAGWGNDISSSCLVALIHFD